MKRFVGSLVMLALGCLPAYAQTDISGTWRADNVGAGAWTVGLRNDQGRLTGRVSSCTSLPVDIQEGTIDGDSIRFKCSSLDGDRTVSLTGKISGDQITFTWALAIRDGGSARPAGGSLPAGDENAWEMFGPSTPKQFTAQRVPNGGTEFAAAFNIPQLDLKVEGTILLPPNVPRVRGVIVLLNSGTSWDGMGGAYYRDPDLRSLSARLGCALLLPRFTMIRRESDPRWILTNAGLGAGDGVLKLLERLGEESAHSELRDAPLLLWGHSRGGQLAATLAALHPDRTIALVGYHSGDLGLAGPDMKVLTQIPALMLEAKSDVAQNASNVNRAQFAQSAWSAGRAEGAPWTFGIEPDAVHQNPDNLKTANVLVLPWIGAVFRQRLAASGASLRGIPNGAAWLGNIQTGEAAPFASFVGPTRDANWFPDEPSARSWRVVSGMTP